MTPNTNTTKVFGLMAEYETGEALVEAARRVRDAGYLATEAYMPHPVEGVTEALGKKKTPLANYVFFGGLTGFSFGMAMQHFASAVDYPLNVGNRPYFAWPNFIPVAFELTILFSAVTAVLGVILMNRLPTPYHPVFNVPAFDRASQDRFFLSIASTDRRFESQGTLDFLRSTGALNVFEVQP